MSRKGRNRVSIKPRSGGTNSVSLFPFLAVLLCTMGALIMLLVVIARNVREQVDHPVVAKKIVTEKTDLLTVAEAEELLRQIEDNDDEAAWFAENFVASKTAADRDLAEARAALAAAEKQAQQFKDEIRRLESLAKQLESSDKKSNLDLEYLKRLLEQRRQQQQDLQSALKKLQDEAEKEAKSYSIIPYRGRGGTFRRPIYIECFQDKVVIQPEGVVLNAEDFDMADRPDNPLDAALRAVRQYYTETQQIERGTEPYPLIIVRPSGVEAYAAVRRAIGSWASEFGYELVDEDWKIDYPTGSEELKDRMEKQVTTSRNRMLGYRAAMRAQQIGESMSKQYRVDSKGNVQEVETPNGMGRGGMSGRGRSSVGSDPMGGRVRHADRRFEERQETASAGNGIPDPNVSLVPRENGMVGGGPGSNSYGNPNGNFSGDASSRKVPENNLGDLDEPMPESLRAELMRNPTGYASSAQMRSTTQNNLFGQNEQAIQNGQTTQSTQSSQSNQAVPAPTAIPYASVYTPENAPGQTLNDGWQAQQNTSQNDQQTDPTANAQNLAAAANQARNAQTASNQTQDGTQASNWMVQPVPTTSGMPALGLTATTTPEMHTQPLNDQQQPTPTATVQNKSKKTPPVQRPDNWALRNIEPFSAAVKRNVKVRCESDKFVMPQQPGLMGVRVVPITDSVFVATDRLVEHLWEFMESWGLAGEKYFWQPVLQIEVAPGAEQRFEELRWLLRNSGLVIEKAETNQRRR